MIMEAYLDGVLLWKEETPYDRMLEFLMFRFSGREDRNKDLFGYLGVDWVDVDVIPEPSTLAVLCLGVVFIGLKRKKF